MSLLRLTSCCPTPETPTEVSRRLGTELTLVRSPELSLKIAVMDLDQGNGKLSCLQGVSEETPDSCSGGKNRLALSLELTGNR